MDIFEHGIFSCPHRLTQASLLSLVKTLQQSSIDGKITSSQWAEAAIKQLSLSLQESNVYFEIFRHLAYSRRPSQPVVDVKQFSLFLVLQLFSTTTTRLSLEKASSLSSKFNSEYPGINNLGSSFPSPGASPRTKAVRGFLFTQSSSDIQLAYQFIRSHLKLLLKVVAVDMNENNPMITSGDFNHLSLVFVQGDQPLCKYVPYFNAKPRVGLEELSAWITKKLLSPVEAPQTDAISLNGLSKGVTLKNASECNGRDLRICNCDESYIYVNAGVRQVSILSCREVTVYVSSVSGLATMDKCENCTLVILGSLIRVGNCVDTTVHVYSPFPLVLYGDNRGVNLAPFNVNIPDLPVFMENCGIPASSSNPKCIHNWSSPVEMNTENAGQGFTLMQPKDFYKLVLPTSFNSINPGLAFTPEEFVNAIKIREEYFESIQNMISKANLNEEQEKRLHMAIQGYFREWLVSSGNIKGPLELVKLIDQD
jgi:TBCC domain-containing protein 1